MKSYLILLKSNMSSNKIWHYDMCFTGAENWIDICFVFDNANVVYTYSLKIHVSSTSTKHYVLHLQIKEYVYFRITSFYVYPIN